LKTIRYGQQFGVEYNREEIKERMISDKNYSNGEVETELEEMKYPKNIKNDRMALITKVDKTKKIAKRLVIKFPDILMIGITGSVAAGFPKLNEDIDLMIIVKKDSLWITRILVEAWMRVNKIPHRKYGAKQIKDDYCINLWLEEGSLELPINRHGLKNAMDLILMKPIINKNNIYGSFINSNSWAKKFVATGYDRIIFPKGISQSSTIIMKKPKTNIIKNFINRVMFWGQYLYMRRKITEETVDIKRAFFHPNKRK